MMIQGTIPKAFCLLFTPWLLDGTMMVSSLVTLWQSCCCGGGSVGSG